MRRRRFIGAAGLLPAVLAQAQVTDLSDAINKAGRQRMLSQRMAKSYYAAGLDVIPDLPHKTLSTSITLFERQLAELKSYAPQAAVQSTYTQLELAWRDYKTELVAAAPSRAHADSVAGQADKVLALAHQGTLQLEKLSGKPVGKLVNVAGRQRMLSQRMAAMYLSASWSVQTQVADTELAKARGEFVAAHALLTAAPETTPAIAAALDLADKQFFLFDAALRTLAPGHPNLYHMRNVFTGSERILQVMDEVTGLYSKLS